MTKILKCAPTILVVALATGCVPVISSQPADPATPTTTSGNATRSSGGVATRAPGVRLPNPFHASKISDAEIKAAPLMDPKGACYGEPGIDAPGYVARGGEIGAGTLAADGVSRFWIESRRLGQEDGILAIKSESGASVTEVVLYKRYEGPLGVSVLPLCLYNQQSAHSTVIVAPISTITLDADEKIVIVTETSRPSKTKKAATYPNPSSPATPRNGMRR